MLLLPIDQLKEHPQQPKLFKAIDGEDWEAFVSDIGERGIAQHIIVSDRAGEHVIVDGHQRDRRR